MEEVTTWKGQTFTLMVFTGIVVLASIFFILGMLVGRAQGQKVSVADLNPLTKTEVKSAAAENKQELSLYDSAKKEPPAVFERVPTKLEPPAVSPAPAKLQPAAAKPQPAAAKPQPVTAKHQPAPERTPEIKPSSGNLVNYQVAAVRKPSDAEKLLEGVKKKGFRAFIVPPAPGDANPYFRIQVGPFSDPAEAQETKKKLESAGYQPIARK
jgi:cell division septation protein DedD